MPALRLDAALVHANRADTRGNCANLGPDPYFDDLMLEAAAAGYVSCERLVTTESLADEASPAAMRTNRMFVTGVVDAPNGAHPTSCLPDHPVDHAFMAAYAASAKSGWADFATEHLAGSEAEYQHRVHASGPEGDR